jgi:hypothetical protein
VRVYEHHSQPLLSTREFAHRALGHALVGLALVAATDGLGTLGYHVLGGLPWIDAFLNASMILGGMGPVDLLHSTSAKLFASVYALFSGLVFIALMAVILGPWVHRLLHKVHLEGRQSK